MTWHFQAAHEEEDGHHSYTVREVYEGIAEDNGIAWTAEPISPAGETLEELVEELHMMMADVVKYPVLEVDDE
jgi:hypothetical protein